MTTPMDVADTQTTHRAFYERLRMLDRSPWLPVMVGLACLISGTATYFSLTNVWLFSQNPILLYSLYLIDLVLVMSMIVLVARNIVRIVIERRRGGAGSRLHSRIALLFGLVAIVPIILVATFSTLFFNLGVQAWFSNRVQVALQESQNVAAAYVEEHQKFVRADAIAIADFLRREQMLSRFSQDELSAFLTGQVDLRNLSEAIVFEETGNVLAQAKLSFAIALDGVPVAAIQDAQRGDVVILKGADDDRVRALIQVDASRDAYLYIGRLVDAQVIAHAERVQQATEQFFQLEGARAGFEQTFAMYYLVVAMVLLLIALWLGLQVANRLVQPISGLVQAAEQVGAGDLDARVRELPEDDEMALLSRSFNRMTERLQSQQSELLEANQQLDRRRRFTEAVLDSATAGILRVDSHDVVTLSNRTAADLLSWDGRELRGMDFRRLAPEMSDILHEARRRTGHTVEAQIEVIRQARRRTLLVHMFGEQTDNEISGVVVTFDDITDLLSAQRTAAWADVARRIAHEIKNPLTPIQLSAERLKRKYGAQITGDKEIFDTCIDTIRRHVNAIGTMVDEFSSFARMPAPRLRRENLVPLVHEAVVLFRNVDPKTRVTFDPELTDLWVNCDSNLITQVLNNLIKNAGEAIADQRNHYPNLNGMIDVQLEKLSDHEVCLRVVDNGVGLPKEGQDKLTEPYVTTKKKGTGLGLAIVHKIIEDHSGSFSMQSRSQHQKPLDDAGDAQHQNEQTGTCVSVTLPLISAAVRTDAHRDIEPKSLKIQSLKG